MKSVFFKSREYFPIEVKFEDKEVIKITKRPRKVSTEIFDIYANKIHIGMFIGLEKIGETLHFGPTGLNKSHSFRKILNFVFVKLLEYYGLTDLNRIVIDIPEDIEFKDFLLKLGFQLKESKWVLDLTKKKIEAFLKYLDQNYPAILDREGQIKNIVQRNLVDSDEEKAKLITKNIIKKVKDRERLGQEFLNNRAIQKLKTTLNIAILHSKRDVFKNHLNIGKLMKENLIGEEFLDFFFKTLISSFDLYLRQPYLEEIFKSIDEKKEFSLPYVQDLIDKFLQLIGDKKIDKEKYRKWITRNNTAWEIREKIRQEKEDNIIEQSRLETNNFAKNIKLTYKPIVEALVNHYNNVNIFFGMENSFK